MRRLLLENLGWKLLSLLVAVMLWFTIVGEPRLVTSVYAPVEFRNIPADLEISSETPERVLLEVQGSSTQLQSSALSSVAVVLDLGSVFRSGERTFTVDQSTVVLPPGVKLVRAVPSQLRLRLEQRISREVPVQVRFSGPPPEGYRIGHHEVQPPRLRIVGPESRVEQVEFAETDPVDLASVVGEREFQVHTYVADPQVRFESSPAVNVKVFMEKIPSAGSR